MASVFNPALSYPLSICWVKLIHMFTLLKGLAGPAIKYLGPAVANWGLNKLFSSNMMNSVIPK